MFSSRDSRPGETFRPDSLAHRTCNAVSAPKAARSRATAGGRAVSASPGSQGVISQRVPRNSWTERWELARMGTGVSPVSEVRKSQWWTRSRWERAGPSGGQARSTSVPELARNLQNREPLSPPARPMARAQKAAARARGYRARSSFRSRFTSHWILEIGHSHQFSTTSARACKASNAVLNRSLTSACAALSAGRPPSKSDRSIGSPKTTRDREGV